MKIKKEILIIRPEIALIKILLNIDLYNKYRSYININKEDREVLYLYSTLDKMMESYNRSLSFDEYQLTVTSNVQDKTISTFILFFICMPYLFSIFFFSGTIKTGTISINTIKAWYKTRKTL